MSSGNQNENDDLPPAQGQRYKLAAESELRFEVPPNKMCQLILVQGSAELFGVELALSKAYSFVGKLAVFTWHGCTIDVDAGGGGGGGGDGSSSNNKNNIDSLDIIYTSDETQANIAYVNTHAQLEVMRDEALAKTNAAAAAAAAVYNNTNMNMNGSSSSSLPEGPRVLVVGPADSGKTSLVRVLTAYAVKLGRTPILVDLDPSINLLSVPGTLSSSPMNAESVSVMTHGNMGSLPPKLTPLVFFYGSTDLRDTDTTTSSNNADCLFNAQVSRMGECIDRRLENDPDARASGIIVNTGGPMMDVGYSLLLHAMEALRITVVLIMGHDRLYSMLTTHVNKRPEDNPLKTKVIKLPRSGGVVMRDAGYRRMIRSMSIKKYFYGDLIPSSSSLSSSKTTAGATGPEGGAGAGPTMINQYTPFSLQVSATSLVLYKLSSVSLAASMLPVSAKQRTESVQLTRVVDDWVPRTLLAVCHPSAVESYERTGEPGDLYLSGMAGFCVVESHDSNTDMVSLLSPCAGSLPSNTLLMGEITWME